MESCRPSSVSRSFFENNNQRTTPPTIDEKIVLANERRGEKKTHKKAKKKLFRLYICVQTLSFDLGRIRGQSQSRESRLHGSARRCSPSSSSSLLYTQSELRPVCVEWSSTHEKKLNTTSTEIIENYSSSSQAPRARRDFFVILFRNVFGRLM